MITVQVQFIDAIFNNIFINLVCFLRASTPYALLLVDPGIKNQTPVL